MGGGLFGEGGPLRVAHNAAAAGIMAGEFASGDEWRLGSAGVSSAGGEQVGEVEAAGFDFDHNLIGSGMRVRDILQFENSGPPKREMTRAFMRESSAGVEDGRQARLARKAPSKTDGPGVGVRNIMGPSFRPLLPGKSWRLGRGESAEPVDLEGAVETPAPPVLGKETLAVLLPAVSFPCGSALAISR